MKKFHASRKCPKCGFAAITDKFFKAGGHLQCTVSDASERHRRVYETLTSPFFGSSVRKEDFELLTQLGKERDAIPEHIERTCLRCGFGWAEATLDPYP